MAKRYRLKAATMLFPVLLSGCAVGPDFKKPETWTPAQWQHASLEQTSRALSVPVNQAPDPQWWSVFHDPELVSLEQRLATQNLDILQATQQMAVSRGQLLLAGAERFPDLAATGSYRRQQYSSKQLESVIKRIGKNAPEGSDALLSSQATNASIPLLNQWQDGLQASWEVDLWGRVRRQYEAAKSYLQATVEQRRGILIARQAELAQDYLSLRSTQEQLRITRRNKEVAVQMLDLSRNRYNSGLVSELDVESARSQVEDTSARIPQYEQLAEQQINAINLLMGAPPGALNAELQTPSVIPSLPPVVPVGVPSEVVRRRPDIRQAEAELHAATAEVGQAEADFYPKVTIDAGFGMQSFSFRDLGMWGARAWNVGPSISIPIFQGGRLVGQLRMKKASQKTAALRYRKTVLTAWSEVDNALTKYEAEQKRNMALKAQVAADQRSLSLSRDLYRQGLRTFLPVLDAERRVLSSQTALTTSNETMSENLVRLYNAIGGGWEEIYPEAKNG